MMTRTIATLFSGGEGFGVGASAAGLRHLWGVEYDAKIAAVAEANGYRSIVASVCDVDYATLESPYHLHASPVCKEYSDANADGAEGPEEIAQAHAICRAIVALRPHVFTLENVRAYARPGFSAFAAIVATLHAEGYGVTRRVLNSADYGVPQTRERLILRAVRGQDRPLLPTPTHARADKIAPMLDDRMPWVGWHAAIRDLIPTLRRKASLSDAKRNAIPDHGGKAIFLNNQMNVDGGRILHHRYGDEPLFTLVSTTKSTSAYFIIIGDDMFIPDARVFARIQSFPDAYALPDNASLATTVIGNAVPPLLSQRICEL
jgi:DNA (cytosine-5)-methyltransferase 1